MNRSRCSHFGSAGSTRRMSPYNTATMSAIENTEPICELPPPLVIFSACRRILFASSRVGRSAASPLTTVELPNARADVVNVVGADHHVHGEHQAPLEESVGVREVAFQAECRELVDRLAAPLDDGAHAAVGKELTETFA